MSDEPDSSRRIALFLSREEADCLLSLLLHSGPLEGVPEETLLELLRRVTEAQRRSGLVRLPGNPTPNTGKVVSPDV